MRRRATRFLHVLACAPAAALGVAAMTPASHARAASEQSRPAQVIVALDPGHGGSPDNNHPDQPFDPGAIADNGLMEKDAVLDIAKRARALLQQDMVKVVMTRNSDVWLDIGPRTDIANASGAVVFVSIHLNDFQDSPVGGSVVLF